MARLTRMPYQPAEVVRQEADREEGDALLDKLIEDPEVQALLKRKM